MEMQKSVRNESSAGKMERNDLPTKVTEVNPQIGELVKLIDTLRQNKNATIPYRDVFFKRLKTYI